MAKKKKKMNFRGKVSKDAKRQKANENGSTYLLLPKGVEQYSPAPGKKESFDIIPYEVSTENHLDKTEGFPAIGDFWYKRTFKIHKNVGAENETKVCLTSVGKKCPICDFFNKQRDKGVEWDEISDLRSTTRNLYAIKPIGIKDTDEDSIYIWDMSFYLFQKQLNDELEENDKYENFPDLENGKSISVRWNKEAFKSFFFAKAGRIDFLKRKEPLDEAILEKVPKLDECLEILSYDELKSLYFGGSGEKEEADTDEPELSWGEITEMDVSELIDVIDYKKLDIVPEDHEDVSTLMKSIAKELGIKITKKKDKMKRSKKKK